MKQETCDLRGSFEILFNYWPLVTNIIPKPIFYQGNDSVLKIFSNHTRKLLAYTKRTWLIH